MSYIKILIADDHPVVREGLKTMLQAVDDFEVVGQARDGEEAIKLVETLSPDVAILDIRMPIIEGIEATQRIRKQFPQTEVIILSSHDQEEYIFQSIQAGAKGYIIKDSEVDELIQAVRTVAVGDSFIPSTIATKLVEHLATPKKALTDREQMVLSLLAQGLQNREIAAALKITERTVKSHVTNIMTKLNVKNRTEALSYALKKGLVTLE